MCYNNYKKLTQLPDLYKNKLAMHSTQAQHQHQVQTQQNHRQSTDSSRDDNQISLDKYGFDPINELIRRIDYQDRASLREDVLELLTEMGELPSGHKSKNNNVQVKMSELQSTPFIQNIKQLEPSESESHKQSLPSNKCLEVLKNKLNGDNKENQERPNRNPKLHFRKFGKQLKQKIQERTVQQSEITSTIGGTAAGKQKSWEARIIEAIDLLGKGIKVDKYCFRRDKIQKVILYFSEDFKFMSIFNVDKNDVKLIRTNSFSYVEVGAKTTRFQQYIKKGYVLNEQECFSLVFKERSYDFIGENKQLVSKIVENIRLLWTCS